MAYYAHTAEDKDGNRLPENSGKWQPLAAHLRNVADLAKRFALPLKPPAQGEVSNPGPDYVGPFRPETRVCEIENHELPAI